MVDSKTCPVCGRKDIPDFHNEDVTCPYCGSDLKPYRIIDAIEMDSKSKSTVWKPVAIAAMLATLLFAILYFTKGSSPTAQKEKISMMEDSIAALNEIIKDNKAATGKQMVADATTTPGKSKVDEKNATEQPVKEAENAQPEDNQKEEITAPAGQVTVKNGKKIYVVKKGDTWSGICRKLYNGKVKPEELAKMNGKTVKDIIDINEELIVK
jgi:hypothetical protein